MWTVSAVGLLVVCTMMVGDSQPISKSGKPCSASRLRVQAPNNVVGTWSMILGQLQGNIQHQTRLNASSDDQAGNWESSIYNRDEGCSDSDVRMFEGTDNGDVVEAGMPPGYEVLEGLGTYKAHIQPATWDEAKVVCQSEGASLAVANSKDEATALGGLLQVPAFHVGLYWSEQDDDFTTLQGILVGQTGYHIWGRGQPDEYNGESPCVEMSATGELFDIPCSYERPFICELSY